ncbi:MAG: LCP family protein, partial [Clostridiales bacterium]|nr:LCP family protein [Clostridiales bacterium]
DDGSAENAIGDIEEEEDPVEAGEGSEDIVIFGVDTRANNLGVGTRSDSIMIVHIDYDEQTVKVLSIYRDCMVHIEDHGYEKITHAHSYGGPDLAVSTINENFDLNIDKYITLNFVNVANLIDEIGGVEMDITDEEAPFLSEIDGKFCGTITSAGTYLLDGDQAVKYSRIRYATGGDYRRAERQRDVLFNLFEKAKTLSVNDRLSLAEDMLKQVNSNCTSDDLTSILYYMSKYTITEMDSYPKVFYGGKVDGAWVEVPVSLTDMAEGIHEFLYGDDEDYTPSDTVLSYSSYLNGVESKANNDQTSGQYTEENVEGTGEDEAEE